MLVGGGMKHYVGLVFLEYLPDPDAVTDGSQDRNEFQLRISDAPFGRTIVKCIFVEIHANETLGPIAADLSA